MNASLTIFREKIRVLFDGESLARHFSIYFLSSVAARAIPFMLLPIVTHYLVPAEYGVWALFWMFVTLLIPVMAVGGQHHVNRNFHELEKNILANHLYNLCFQSGAVFAIFLLLAFGLQAALPEVFSIPSFFLPLIPVIALLMTVQKITANLLLFEKKPRFYALTEVMQPLLTWSIAAALITYLGWNWPGIVLGSLIAAGLVALLCLAYIYRHRWLRPKFNLQISRDMLRVNGPLIPHLLMMALYGMVDRLMLEQMMSTAEVGVYSIGYAIGLMSMIFISAFTKVWQPWLYAQFKALTPEKENRIVFFSYLYFLVVGLGALLIWIAGAIYINLLFTEAYHPAIAVVFWIALTGVPQVVVQTSLVYLNYKEKTLWFPVISFSSILVNLAANAIMIPQFGLVGAAVATLLASCLKAFFIFMLAQYYMPLPWLGHLKEKIRKSRNGS